MECIVETTTRLVDKATNHYFSEGDIITTKIIYTYREVTGKIISFNDNCITLDCSKQFNSDIQVYEYEALAYINLLKEAQNTWNIRDTDELVNIVKETLDEVGIPYTENTEGDGSIVFNGLTNKDYGENEYSEEYNKVQEELKIAPQYIKDEYNENFATSKHAKKI